MDQKLHKTISYLQKNLRPLQQYFLVYSDHSSQLGGTTGSCSRSVHCGTIKLNQTKEVPHAKFELVVESQPPPKQPVLTAISKITHPTSIEKLGTWQASILFRNL